MRVGAVNCAACGASLDLLGGRHARGLACRYCGAVMDGHEGYRLVVQHRDLRRPETPLALGMRGRVKGVEFTVIGTVEWCVTEEGKEYRWVDHQLFSPTHGYAWLTWNDGHFVFSRRTRDLPEPADPTYLKRRRQVRLGGREYRIFEGYDARITFVEGELTWVARLGDAARTVEAIDPPHLLAFEQSGDEWEHAMGEWLDPAEVRQAFGLPKARPPASAHPLKPFRPSPAALGLARAGRVFVPVAVAGLVLTAILGQGRPLLQETVAAPGAEVGPFAFDVASPDRLLRLELGSPVRNDWVFYDIRVMDDDDQEVVAAGREISFYEGREGGEYWSEGSTTGRVLFRVPEAGRYLLELESETEGGRRAPALTVTLREGVLVLRYFVVLLALALAAALSLYARRWVAEASRWSDDG